MALAESFVRAGKVSDLYTIDERRLLLVASDRISAFDVVLPTPIPDKGRVLTGLSRFWFAETDGLVANHVLGTDPSALPPPFAEAAAELRGRSLICRRARVLPVECIVRGYLSGSGWKDYRSAGAICGIPLPPGLRESDRLPEPLFTPSTKADLGAHDENIGLDAMVALVGGELTEQVRAVALELYRFGAAHAEARGIILADTKFEFGLEEGTERLLLIDEVMTPDSSRFWDADDYEPGRPQASFDKQFVRDWLETLEWAKTAPGPELPPEVVGGTRRRYVEAFERLTGASFQRYLAEDVIAPDAPGA
ncbi:MAG: phosphoribosylaminoimidazolesuccinocarboxamide synthase [Candidatus Limnocylindrales bacterium]